MYAMQNNISCAYDTGDVLVKGAVHSLALEKFSRKYR